MHNISTRLEILIESKRSEGNHITEILSISDLIQIAGASAI